MSGISETITFLGTAGARFMVSRQLLASGGAWIDLHGTQILVDPGPGCLVHAINKKLDPSRLDAIILSHKHLDHSGDINVMIEAMTAGGTRKRGLVFAPGDALNQDPVILRYIRSYPKQIEVLVEGGTYQVNDISFTTPIRHQHSVETYGFVFRSPYHTFSWITDTKYFEGLASHYTGELLILNVAMLDSKVPSRSLMTLPLDHLSFADAGRLVELTKPRVAILTHFGMKIWRAGPSVLAERMSGEKGIQVIAASDGMRFDFSQLENKK
jgi:phosphoribosyl 1,2-cyclic phosphodiesterase